MRRAGRAPYVLTRPIGMLGILAALACQPGGQDDAMQAQRPAEQAPAVTPSAAMALPTSRRTVLTDAVARVSPAVVTVQTEAIERAPVDPFEFFFGGRGGGSRSRAGIGSGFITQGNGIIVTNAHVVAGATRISVALRDGTTYPATLVGADEANDLAVLRIKATGLPVAPLGRSDALVVGEWAIAIGNPYGFLLGNTEPSVTVGVISGTGRNLVSGTEDGAGVYVDMIQTDASINPGNSGGPLVNAAGEVIGVNSSIYTPSGGSIGLGFAIPINRARRVTDDLLEHGTVRRPWVGIKAVLPEAGSATRAALAAGVVVKTVTPGSPAAKAGLEAGDVLVKAGNRTLRNPYDWDAILLETRPGEALQVMYRRAGRDASVSLRVSDLPEVSAPKVQVLKELELVTLTPAIRTERGIRAARGAVVYTLSQRVQDELGLAPGDVIVQVNRTPIEDAAAVARVLGAGGGRQAFRLFFERAGQVYTTDFVIQ
jgi:serine protease Do